MFIQTLTVPFHVALSLKNPSKNRECRKIFCSSEMKLLVFGKTMYCTSEASGVSAGRGKHDEAAFQRATHKLFRTAARGLCGPEREVTTLLSRYRHVYDTTSIVNQFTPLGTRDADITWDRE
jgi:hypothetical protein